MSTQTTYRNAARTAATAASTSPVVTPRRRPTWRQLAAGVGILVAAGSGLLSIGEKDATSLVTGDCIASLPDGDLTAVRTTSCDDEHEAEVVATAGSVTSEAAALDVCEQAFARFGSDPGSASLTGTSYWTQGGGDVVCVVSGAGLTSPLQSLQP